MIKKKLKKAKKTKKGFRAPKSQTGQIGTKVTGLVNVPYVQTGVPESHAQDVCDALAQLILSDTYRGYTGVTAKGENHE